MQHTTITPRTFRGCSALALALALAALGLARPAAQAAIITSDDTVQLSASGGQNNASVVGQWTSAKGSAPVDAATDLLKNHGTMSMASGGAGLGSTAYINDGLMLSNGQTSDSTNGLCLYTSSGSWSGSGPVDVVFTLDAKYDIGRIDGFTLWDLSRLGQKYDLYASTDGGASWNLVTSVNQDATGSDGNRYIRRISLTDSGGVITGLAGVNALKFHIIDPGPGGATSNNSIYAEIAAYGADLPPTLADAANSTVVALPTTVASDGTTTSTITVTLKDSGGTVVAGKTVTLASNRGATDTISAASGVSSASGVVTFTVKSSASGAAVFTATDVSDSLVITQTATVSFVPPASIPVADDTVYLLASSGDTTSSVVTKWTTAQGSAPVDTVNDLLKNHASVSMTAGNVAAGLGCSLANINDGLMLGGGNTSESTAGLALFTNNGGWPSSGPADLVFTLDAHYDIARIDSFTLWDPSRTGQKYDLYGSTDGGANWTLVASVNKDSGAEAGNRDVRRISLTNAGAVIPGLASVNALKFHIMDPGPNGNTSNTSAYSEIAAYGAELPPALADAANSTMTANPTAVSCDGVSTATLTVTLRDANSYTVAGKTVTLAKASGPGTPVIATLSGTTNGSGVATFTVASTTAGTDVFSATDVTDSVTLAQTAAVTFAVNSFASWTVARGLAGGDASLSADPDQDGIANAIEYVLGGEPNPANPDSNSLSLLPTVAQGAGHMLFTYRRTALSFTQPGLDIVPAYSSDLLTWKLAEDRVDGVAITVTKDGFASGVDKVEVALPQALAVEGRLFARLMDATPDSQLPDQVASQLAACDVVWDSPSTNSAGSMPLGNGDIGLNAWVEESGDLVFFISKTDAWTDCGRMVKLGQVRVRLTPSLAVLPFRQQLQLLHGQMVITSGTGGSATTLRLWVDANRPVIHIEAESQQDMQAQVGLYVWRTADRDWQGDGTVGYISQLSTGPLIEKADTVVPQTDNRIVWYHRNELTIYPWTMAAQGLTSLVPMVPDPLLHRTFGGCISGAGLVQAEAGAATQALTTAAPTRRLDVAIDVLTAQTDTAGQWLDQLNDIVVEEQGTGVAAAWAAHCQWWEDFWNRSWIFVHAPEDDTTATAEQIAARVTARDALQLTGNGGLSNHIRPAVSTDPDGPVVTSGYARQRFVTAAAGRGAYPIKHDGSIFTVNTRDPASLVEADYRVHGANYWFLDSATTSYGPMLRSGDYEQLLPLFGMYRAMVPMARERTKLFFGHEGVFIPATVYPWGTYQSNEYVQYLWQGGLELTAKMLDYYEATQNVAFLRETLLPLADGVATFYDQHWARDTNGKIRLDPACALESVHHAVNPLPEIAGLWYVLPRLLALPVAETTTAQRAAWAETLADLPNVPMSGTAGAEICVAAEVIYDRQGDEMPELYGVFPYRLYALGCPDFDIGRRSVEAYSPAPPQTVYPLAGRVGGWRLNPIQVAFVGKAQQAAGMVVSNFASHDPGSRFPAFWGPNQVGSKDQSHGGVSMTALQAMLLQVEGRKIYLFPAWPKTWDVNFKLHALYNTTVEGELRDGQVISLKVTPESRTADVVNLLDQ